MANKIPEATIHTLARSIFREASNYGFNQIDFIRLVNELMDMCTSAGQLNEAGSETSDEMTTLPTEEPMSLPIHGTRVSIRGFDKTTDVELLQAWLPDKYGRYFVLSSVSAQAMTLENLIGSERNHLGIIELIEGGPIGAVAYLDHSKEQRRAELRKLIGEPNARGRGFAEEATRLWIRYGVGTLDLEKIFVSTLQTHIENIKLNEKIGFQVEGLLRNEVLIEGIRHDVLRMGIWRDEVSPGGS